MNAPPPLPKSNGTRCERPGCTGMVIDGVCEDCGRPPLGQSILTQEAGTVRTAVLTGALTGFPSSRSGTVGTGRTGSRRQTSRSSRGSSTRRQALGGGLISLPPQASQDPLKLVMATPEVPERKRRCPGCDAKVNRTHGFCPQCGQEYNFEPSLSAGMVVNGKFEIKGPMAFGGLGWIYLAWDQTLSRWVVLKGLLNAKNEASAAAAVAERQFLAAVKHPKIVGIYDFVQHGSEGFIVMEYVGGRTIESIRRERRLLPPEEAVAYILGILPAFSYLHANGFVYCDFKPDNFMLENDDVKLIDMGGVRRISDPHGDVYGTKGYMAPEAADDPVAVSDLYTIGRSLALLVMDFKYQTTYEHSLPTPMEEPVLAHHEALYRFLLRSTHPDPDERFQSADEMADQLYGVLREMVALQGAPKPAESRVFTADNLLDAEDNAGAQAPLPRLLPIIKLDATDKAANDLLRLGVITDPQKRLAALQQLAGKFGQKSVEVHLRLADALLRVEDFDAAHLLLNRLEAEDAFDWRVHWYRGVAHLAQGRASDARNDFDRVYFEMPGEAAPKLAIGLAAEASGEKEVAAHFYNRVSKLDPNHTSACFGLARCLMQKGDPAGAAEALAQVPASHSLFTLSRITLAQVLMGDERRLTSELLEEAAHTLESISSESGMAHQLAARLFSSTLDLLGQGKVRQDPKQSVLGHRLIPFELRAAAEKEYRSAARFASTPEEKIRLVNLANAIRPLTLF